MVTSAQAAARVLVEEHGSGARVLMLGGEGLRVALVEAGLEPVDDPEGAVAVASGYGPDVRWRDIMRVSTLVRDGLPYVASNADLTIPTPYGLAPGHGVLVRTITGFAGVDAIVAGKPEKPLMEETVLRVGGDRPLMVGDRLDTDIEGAHAIDVALAAGAHRCDLARGAGRGAAPPATDVHLPDAGGPVRAASRAVGRPTRRSSSAAGPRASGTVG